ncbi:MAG: hypothetical protein AMQ22_01995 [Candidatus Methanofastidiosum methylothiophilum]|uniref:Uncharacterized protein n=1 Tax=Candidatus Methanofastidiosum methylothiophilum TaxID=1705564 RepID=A0A150IQQ8_9EURY|nr:MAG: hypothetical protein AMQ22_01995 [Candidatus Methanofastidiosum methylthiophilus]
MSIFSITVAPVVVNPDIVSKYASRYPKVPERKNGSAPKAENAAHPNDTTPSPSISLNPSSLVLILLKPYPEKKVSAMQIINTRNSFSP